MDFYLPATFTYVAFTDHVRRLGIVKKARNAKVAVYTCGIDISQTETKGTVLLRNAEEMLNFTTGEEKQMAAVRAHFV